MNITNICAQIFSSVDARVGLDKTSYTVDKKKGVVEICAHVFEPDISCPIDFAFFLTFDTINVSAGSYNICIFINFITLY